MIRKIQVHDLGRIRAMEAERAECDSWEFGPDYIDGLAYTDSADRPVVIVGAWHRAETHLLMDSTWGTPAMRQLAFEQVHAALEAELKQKGVGQVITWLVGKLAFARRLKQLGWIESSKQSFHRRVV